MNASKLKSFSLIILKELLQSIFQIFWYKIGKTFLCLLFTLFPFSFKFLQAWLMIKELIKHKNKFNRKVFHDRENSENQFSHFHEMLQKVYHEHFSVVYTMKLSWNTYFMKCSERNISQCILALRIPNTSWRLYLYFFG